MVDKTNSIQGFMSFGSLDFRFLDRKEWKGSRINIINKKMNIKMDMNSEPGQTLFAKIENSDVTYQSFVKKVAKLQFQVKAIIQDILECRDSMETLNALNEKGRSMITLLREEVENLHAYGSTSGDETYSDELISQQHLLSTLLKEFKNANISSMLAIEKAQRDELLQSAKEEGSTVRNRKKKVDSDGLLHMSTGVTEQLLSISRQLAATTQRSQDTLDNLVSSSSTVHGTHAELQNTGSTISQSSKLLKKYGRREFTDKVIMFFAFLFFLAVCLYIVQKRLF